MGIEPTGDKVNSPPTGFEDRGRHQAYKHFRARVATRLAHLTLTEPADVIVGTGR